MFSSTSLNKQGGAKNAKMEKMENTSELLPTNKKENPIPPKAWTYEQFKNYLIAIGTSNNEFRLPLNQFPKKIQLSEAWHQLLNQMRKESKDGKERFAGIGINDQKLYLPKTPEVGNENEVPFEALTRHHDRMRMAQMSGKIGDIHSHPNKFWGCFMEDSDVQAFSTQDLFRSITEIEVNGLVEHNRNLFVFRSKEANLTPLTLDLEQFNEYWNLKMGIRHNSKTTLKTERIINTITDNVRPFLHPILKINKEIAKKYNLVIYSGKPNRELKRMNP